MFHKYLKESSGQSFFFFLSFSLPALQGFADNELTLLHFYWEKEKQEKVEEEKFFANAEVAWEKNKWS